ncbi:hypothetical protein H671_4g13150 [Cricetulus griseus]|uniref:Uncharacterized protein n=1 Tax=Cricetulus griseus TaxID=10029 RepID=A0A061I180_CRIGR|nr:hypothetical protein H671_4g13150 [Cricetulus griseus]
MYPLQSDAELFGLDLVDLSLKPDPRNAKVTDEHIPAPGFYEDSMDSNMGLHGPYRTLHALSPIHERATKHTCLLMAQLQLCKFQEIGYKNAGMVLEGKFQSSTEMEMEGALISNILFKLVFSTTYRQNYFYSELFVIAERQAMRIRIGSGIPYRSPNPHVRVRSPLRRAQSSTIECHVEIVTPRMQALTQMGKEWLSQGARESYKPLGQQHCNLSTEL